jgi:N-sulfoglucosamine sulfohydrolase
LSRKLQSNRDEIHNLADAPAHRGTREELAAKLKDWQRRTKDPWIVKYEYECMMAGPLGALCGL